MPGVPFERGDRVTLRTVERDDAAFLQQGRNHPRVRPPLGLSGPENRTEIEETVEDDFEGRHSVNLLVCRDEAVAGDASETDESESGDPTPMGAVNVTKTYWDRPTLSYWLLPEYQGEGYATEALELLLDHFFDTYDARGLQARVFSHNEPSQALLERVGFTREARLRENRFVEGAYRDELVFGILREEWVGE